MPKDLWSGSAGDTVWKRSEQHWEVLAATGKAGEISAHIKGFGQEAVKKRPPDQPSGAAAPLRQRGAGVMSSHLGGAVESSTGKPKGEKTVIPNRGDIWPANVKHIAMPPEDLQRVNVCELSETASSWLQDTMLAMCWNPKVRRSVQGR